MEPDWVEPARPMTLIIHCVREQDCTDTVKYMEQTYVCEKVSRSQEGRIIEYRYDCLRRVGK